MTTAFGNSEVSQLQHYTIDSYASTSRRMDNSPSVDGYISTGLAVTLTFDFWPWNFLPTHMMNNCAKFY